MSDDDVDGAAVHPRNRTPVVCGGLCPADGLCGVTAPHCPPPPDIQPLTMGYDQGGKRCSPATWTLAVDGPKRQRPPKQEHRGAGNRQSILPSLLPSDIIKSEKELSLPGLKTSGLPALLRLRLQWRRCRNRQTELTARKKEVPFCIWMTKGRRFDLSILDRSNCLPLLYFSSRFSSCMSSHSQNQVF